MRAKLLGHPAKRGAPKSPQIPLFSNHKRVSSSIGRASVSKTECWGFESLLACHFSVTLSQRMKFLEHFKIIGDSWIASGIVYAIALVVIIVLIKNLAKVSSFVGEVKGELRKASWPWDSDPKARGFKKYKELVDSTIVVLIAVILLAGFVQIWDFLQVFVVGFLTDLFV